MSDLISRSALIEALKKYEEECENAMCIPGYAGVIYVVREQPTAYDVDKVERLLLSESIVSPIDEAPLIRLDRVLEIVKGGAEWVKQRRTLSD